MSCNCKHNQAEIARDAKAAEALRELFVKRMTIDSTHNDRRKKDFNQALFIYNEIADEWRPAWSMITLDMVLHAYDNACKDLKKIYCDEE